MADRDPTAGWTREWQAMQQQFLTAWQDAVAQSGARGPVPLKEGLEFWSQLTGARTGHEELTERMVSGTRQVIDLMQGALAAAGGVGKTGATPDIDAWRNTLAASLGSFGLDSNPVLEALRSATGNGAASFEELAAAAREAFGAFAAPSRAWLSTPTFGLAREAQERQQKLARAFAEQAESERGYQQLLLKASQLGLKKFEGKLAERDTPGRQIRSGRELYDLWIDAAEEGYAEVAMSPEFRVAYAAMVDSQMRLRQSIQREVELLSGQFGMPTRSELDSAHRRIADLTRRLAALEESVGGEFVQEPGPAAARTPTARTGADKPRGRAKPPSQPRSKPRAAAVAKASNSPKAAKGSFAERLAQARGSKPKSNRRGKGGRA